MRPRGLAGGIAAAAGALVVALILASGSHSPRKAQTTHDAGGGANLRAPAAASVTISPSTRAQRVPRSFLGLSTEYWTLPIDERYLALYGRVLALIHVIGDGPLVLRIGGDSSDHTFYDPRIQKLPRWAFELTPAFVERTASIVQRLGLRVILDLNLVTGTPGLAAAWARAALDEMPRGSIIGFEVGNEPDLYDRAFWLFATGGERFSGRALPLDITPTSYARDFRSYARALRRTAPRTPLLAPALANPQTHVRWVSTLLAGPHRNLGTISVHRYPYSGCALRGSPAYPTIRKVLSDAASAGIARSIQPVLRVAHRAHLALRLTELNSVTCSGLPSVSNTFATALWAPDTAFELMRAGVDAIHLHAREYAINDPFTFNAQGMVARPLLYGLILFARTLGPDPQLLSAHVVASPALNLKTWAVKLASGRLHLLLIDKGPRAIRVTLRIPAVGPAVIERLSSPSPRATAGVTLGGQWLDRNGRWRGSSVSETVAPVGRQYRVVVDRYSAALLTVRLAG